MNGTVAPVVASCAHTIAGKVVGELHAIYSEIEEKQKKWLETAPEFTCPAGCGACCNHFEPHILECEALYMASWLLLNRRDQALEFATSDEIPCNKNFPDGCPLQTGGTAADESGNIAAGSCGVYGGRALICRLFGYCGDTGRDGKIRFKLCKFHPFGATAGQIREYSQAELFHRFGALPPPMAEFGSKTVQLAGDSASRTELLSTALPTALRKILMLENLHRSALFAQALETANKNDDDGDNDTPNPTPNLPKAS